MRTGRCMCGAVVFSAETDAGFGACHCKMCQRWSAGMFMGVHARAFEITQGAQAVRVFKSSDWAQRAFCSICGSNLYYRLRDDPGASFGIGLLDSLDGLEFKREFFVDLKTDAIEFANETHALTSVEIREKYGVQ